MASPGNQHCANCIGTLLFRIARARLFLEQKAPVGGMLEVRCAGHEAVAAVGRQVGGGRERRGRAESARPGPGRRRRRGTDSAAAEQAVTGRVSGAAERRRRRRVGELDGDGLEEE